MQSGNLSGARQAFEALKDTFHGHAAGAGGPGGTLAQPGPNATGGRGPEIIVNLSNSGSSNPEQITINIANSAQGGEQVSLSVGSQGSNTEQVTFNLAANTNEKIVLNLLGTSSTSTGGSSSTSPTSGGLNVSA